MERAEAPRTVMGLKFFKPLQHLLERLHAQRAHPNRKLHCDQYIGLLLLSYFNPTAHTLRRIQEISTFKAAQRQLGISRASLGSLSEAAQVFDPEPLRQIFLELSEQTHAAALPRPAGLPDDLRVLAADATLWETLPRMAAALWLEPLRRNPKGGFKGHLQFDVFSGTPTQAQFTTGDAGERAVLKGNLRSGALYLLDRGYVEFALYEQILQAGSSFLARLTSTCQYRVAVERELTPAARQAGVLLDAQIELGAEGNRLSRKLRLIKVRTLVPAPHNLHPQHKRGKHKAYERGAVREQEWVLVTDRLDLDADLLVLLYRYRWQIEIFFRWLKCTLGCRHLLAHSENGLNLQMYAALIASLLVTLWTGRKPNVSLLTALNCYLIGWADWEDVQAAIARCKPAQA